MLPSSDRDERMAFDANAILLHLHCCLRAQTLVAILEPLQNLTNVEKASKDTDIKPVPFSCRSSNHDVKTRQDKSKAQDRLVNPA